MRRRVIGATLTVLGVLILLFEPVVGVGGCADPIGGRVEQSLGRAELGDLPGICRDYGSYSWRGLIHYPPGWEHKLALPMLIIGVALVVTGIVLLIKPRRSRGS